jgi:sugar lactone lactonase YvrE
MKKKAIAGSRTVLALALAVFAFGVAVVSAQEMSTTVATGLNGPMGVLVTSDGSVWVIDTGVGGDREVEFPSPLSGELTVYKYGQTARIIRIDAEGTQAEVAILPSVYTSPGDGAGGSRLAMLNGTLYATIGALSGDGPPEMGAVVRIEAGRVTEVVNVWDFESDQNPDGFRLESNPYGLAAGPDGNLWVADAAGNDLLKIDPDTGQIEVVAVFDGVPSPIPNPGRGDAMESDPVPTGVTFDEDGNVYVSLLPGVPFLPGSAKVVKVTTDGDVSDHATGLTMLTDLRTGPDGELYAVSFGRFSEQGPVPNSGAIIRVKEGTESEEILSGLSFPTSIDFNAGGDAYVTVDGMGEPGTGALVMFKGLTSRPAVDP